MDDIQSPYQIESNKSHFQVVDESGRVMLDCGDLVNAEQYAAMLNEAFRRGFKAGYRAAKRGSQGTDEKGHGP
ncbi:MAG TPA: hypothetical protein VNV43_02785 [Candidatus Acidoferrales bacterium]|jgi:hypothetical protein|nr:hypothetical protein [Candidatus Acidoferrales bacterium]